MVSEGSQLNECWILKLLSGPRIFKFLNVCGNQLISIPEQAAYVFVLSVFGENIPTAEFGMILAGNCLLRHRKRNAKFLMRTFTCRSTFLYGYSIEGNTACHEAQSGLSLWFKGEVSSWRDYTLFLFL